MAADRDLDWALGDDDSVDTGTGAGFADEVDDPRRARNVRRLVVACLVGGVAIVVLGVVGVQLVISELRDRPAARERLTSSIQADYRARYDGCVARNRDAEACATKFTQQCANDPRWTPMSIDELSDVCTFGKR